MKMESRTFGSGQKSAFKSFSRHLNLKRNVTLVQISPAKTENALVSRRYSFSTDKDSNMPSPRETSEKKLPT